MFINKLFVQLISACLIGLLLTAFAETTYAAPNLVGAIWYVTTTGNDSNSCTITGSPCLTINGAISKATDGDTIKVAAGTYTGSGTEVVNINKSITLSGGWDESFATQNGMSAIDGENARRGIYLFGIINQTALVENFIIQNGYGIVNNGATLTLNNSIVSNNSESGISNWGTMTINNSVVRDNTVVHHGGGINNSGTMTLNNTVVRDNTTTGDSTTIGAGSTGGGIANTGTLMLNNSSVINNKTSGSGGGILGGFANSLTINNSTISGNTAINGGGLFGSFILNNVTISNNKAASGGGVIFSGNSSLQNTIIAGNSADSGPDCFFITGSYTSLGYNLIEDSSDCPLAPTIGDQFNVNPQLGTYPIGSLSYIGLLPGSPAINAGNPSTCLSTDQRGISRVGNCDIGAYENTTVGAASSFGVSIGANQRIAPLRASAVPLVVYVVDSFGSPVGGINVTFTAPASGPSGTFADTGKNVTEVITNNSGVAVASTFTANNQLGNYNVNATASGLTGSVNFALTNIAWYVNVTGDDSNSCSLPADPCLSINGAISKALEGDAIYVAVGTYTGTGDEVVFIDRDISLIGGWDSDFINQIGVSTIDGQTSRRGITIPAGSTIPIIIERFAIQNGFALDGGGIISDVNTVLNLSYVTIKNNTAVAFGGGIFSASYLTLNNSTINDNESISPLYASGGGIRNNGKLTLNNSTVSGNSSAWNSGGIYNQGVVTLSNSTIVNNSASSVGGIWNDSSYGSGILKIRNSILANNTANGAISNCFGTIGSLGYNLVDNKSGCTLTPKTGDKVGTSANPINPLLTPLQNNGGLTFTHALMFGSPAIDAGNPATPGSSGNTCLVVDQRGVPRPVGASCDIGAFETDSYRTTFKSSAANDGWVLEATEISNTGGSMNSNATSFNLGDSAVDQQYRAILSFDTSALPDTAVITSATLSIKKKSLSGTDPFTILGSLKIDLRKPAFGNPILELLDFNATAGKKNMGSFNPVPVGSWYSANIKTPGKNYINRTGTTQVRLTFTIDDNDDGGADFMQFFSGNAPSPSRPKLILQYYVP